ncbi:MAG: type I 3-dehydroquinate dehydratase [Gammaproteobacteria bacterium]|nr:type I 3-dehydroquinate dehydratase [Gammaproteobacteria bacterium]
MNEPPFPLNGVIGIVANRRDEIRKAAQLDLQCVEMRPDLLLDRGFSLDEILSMVREIADTGMHCLFTLRRHDHGGKFTGTDQEQMKICRQALSSGAHIIDIEWDSECAQELISSGVKTILSYHDFKGMPSTADLALVTERITYFRPAAIKLIPTANSLDDSIRILQWVAESRGGPLRIGFAMGKMGEYSRILSRTFGSPITYAGFDAPIAPGQITVEKLLNDYHTQVLHHETRVVGVSGKGDEVDKWIRRINRSRRAQNSRLIAVPIQLQEANSQKLTSDEIALLQVNAAFLRMDYLVSPYSSPRLIRFSTKHES